MKLSYFCIALLFTIAPYFIGCGTGSYKIEDSEKQDTTKFQQTGAKLKNAYKIQTPPRFTLQVSGGLNLGMAELSSNFNTVFDSAQFSEGLNFGVKNGYGAMIIGKIPLHKEGNVRLNLSANFNRFTSSFLSSSSKFGDVSYNVFAFGVGIENSFNPTFRLKPYIAGEMQANIISGKASITSPTTGQIRNITIKNSFRIGYVIYTGFEYMFNNQVGGNFGIKLTNSNQILKSTKTSDNPDEVPLRDKKDDTGEIEFGGFKNFIFTTFYVGFNVYFGVNDIIYKFKK
ncbi:MAG TPA: hypothetical protein PK605_15050 [Ignavibacteria bacterium]|nr:hypothetical protein [Ignavibacteria bacterium]HAX50313.1 hypothetical protein [Bacteroidota bacterium]HRE11157.1 hypothetical protein [Ignavibacteria bacterium]HRF64801.1 hypothetical protein [Ignavibacteria bacterium]HRJ05719.1 hypothetical protein [Ignavibacteria bacterium]